MCILIGKSLALFYNSFLLIQSFGVIIQKSTFFEKLDLSVVFFIELKCRWLQTGLHDSKNTKQLKIAYGRFFTLF